MTDRANAFHRQQQKFRLKVDLGYFMSENSIHVGVYISDEGEKFDCLFFPPQRSAIAIKMPKLTEGNNTGVGQKFCEVPANDQGEAKTALASAIGSGHW